MNGSEWKSLSFFFKKSLFPMLVKVFSLKYVYLIIGTKNVIIKFS
jgi:hypothetical protein